MTREEAIDYGEMWLELQEDSKDSNTYEFFEIATQVLKQEPCGDAISRKRVVEWLENATDDSIEHAIDSNLEFIPPITPQPCDDCISRKSVEEMIKAEMPERGMWEIEGDKEKETVCEVCVDLMQKLSKLQPVTPQQKIGGTLLEQMRNEIEQRPYGVANDSVIQGMKYERVAILEILDKYNA